MDNSFFEYRNDSTRKSESDSEIIDNSVVAEESFVQIPKSAKKNQTVFVAQSEESDTDDDTESFGEDDVQEAPDTFKSIVRRSSAAGSHVAISSDEESGKRGSIGRQSGNSITKAVVLSSSSNEEASPEILPKRRPQARQKSMDSKSSESSLIRRVKRRMVLTDSENDNSIVIEKEKTKKVQCLKDTPAKIDYVDRFSEKCLPKNMSIMSDDETDSNGDDEGDPASDDGAEAVTDDDEAEYPDEDEMVMSKATRMSIMGVRPKDLGSDESDFIQSSDDSNRLSSALSTHSLNDLPDAGISIHMTPAKTPASTGNHDDQQASNHGNDDMGNLDDSRISCSTFGSPVQDNSFTNDNVPKGNVAVTKDNGTQEVSVEVKSPLKMIQVVDVKKMLKVDDDDDDVTIIDSKPEIIALSSDDDEETVKEKSPISRKKSPLKPSNPPAKASKDNTLRQYLAPSSYPNSGVVYVKKNVRENELNKLNQLQADLHNVRNLLENMDVGTLPDGGVKLIERLSGLEAEVRRQGEKVANMIVETDEPPSNGMSNDGLGAQGNQGLTWEDIQKASNQVQPRMFGKQAMSTHMAERNLILDRLRDLHESLASRPPESADAAPPRGLKSALMPHQLHALAWLQWRETQRPAGGILADDMGLGKTITMISLVVSGKEAGVEDEDDDEEEEWGSGKENSRLVRGGTLVVCPASVLQQWAGEVAAHCRPHALSVCLHHGAARATQPRRLAAYDLVLTTYNILQRDTEKNGVLMRTRWTRVILDEAHIVRNHKSATSVAVAALRGARRWCLTGTPVQNKDLDVFALLKFLRLTPFEDLAMWKKWIDNKSMGGQERLSTIMRCILLRRTKAQLQQRGLLACLPHRDLHKIEVTLSKEEMNVYQKVLVFSKTLFAQFLHQRAEKQADAAGFASSQQAYDKMHKRMVQLHGAKPVKSHEILVLLLRLRQVCCHCGLIAAMLDGQEDVGDVAEDPASVDLLSELNKLSLEDAAEDRRRSKLPVEDEEEGPQQGTTAAEAIRSVLSPSNPVFQLSRMSSKIQAVMDCLLKQVLVNKGHKAVVVSQWTSVLRLVEEELRKANVRSVTLSGQVAVPARPPLVQALNDADSPVRVMLLSLCAGGVGLNLCGANHLLLLDPHWNPQLEEQAQDRIYRVGQKRPVHIYRYMCLDTVEQSIRRLQEAKLQLADNVLTGAKHNNASKLSIEDLKMLFNMGPTGE